jgi:MinD superfamily P-loop ATPase
MNELVVISGKGGTGKTSVVASFAALAKDAVLADCDVDAADLHLVLAPEIRRSEEFSGGKCARIETERCTACGLCLELCAFDAIRLDVSAAGGKAYRVDPISCEGCGVCAWFCPEQAISFNPAVEGMWYVSDTRHGPMVHAKLGIAQDNSGKLVSLVRKEVRKIAETRGSGLLLVDGPPGIGCPVIASITGSSLVLVVTEPTVSGLHDLKRVAELTEHFGIPGLFCVNKWDLNPRMAEEIEACALAHGFTNAGRIRYDRGVTRAQMQQQSVVEYQSDGCAADIRALWRNVSEELTRKTEPLPG